ncbi:hypothetical protein B0H16DRAFT_1556893 [Mycena metata]|uniref:Uncharacterized protein n=1 Tax=Mycena metata TaxID=1033252 RepID=A0AAD7N5E3_9AGAR|nr:hypothetical protein B0H16DRAFT_1556893 [Mycena metata]
MQEPRTYSDDVFAASYASPGNISSQEISSDRPSDSISPISQASSSLNSPLGPQVLQKLSKSLRGTLVLRKGTEFLTKHTAGSEHLWNEFRGRGAPPADEGRYGDVYLDITPPFVLYVRRPKDVRQIGGDSHWMAWNSPSAAAMQPLAEHPLYEDRYLWISASGTGLEWFTRAYWKITEARASDAERLLHEVLVSPKKVASPKRITSSAGQPNNLDQAKKRKRTDSDAAASPPRPFQPPQTFDEIPANIKDIFSMFNQATATANALMPTVDQLVSDTTRTLGQSAVQVQQLRVENDQLKSNIAAQDAALKDLQILLHGSQVACEGMNKEIASLKSNALEKEKEATAIRKDIQNELETFRQRSEAVVYENTRLKNSITQLDAASQEKLRRQEVMAAQADQQAQAKILALETKIIELESVVSTFFANVQQQVAGSLARFPRNA